MLKKKDIVYYARILPQVNIYDVCDMIVRTAEDDWFVAIDKRDRHAFYFNNSDIGTRVFFDRNEALSKVKEAEKSTQYKESETYYEEY